MSQLNRTIRQAAHVAIAASLLGCVGGAAPPSAASASRTAGRASSASASAAPRSLPPLPHGVTGVVEVAFSPSGLAAGDDAIWAEDHAATNAVYAVDPETGETLAEFPVGRPCDLAVAFDRVWVADLAAGTVLSIDPDAREIVGEVPDLSGPCGVQAVSGALWTAVDSGIARIKPADLAATVTDIGEAAFPGIGQPLWAVGFASGDLLRIDPATGEVLATQAPPGGPGEGLQVAAGFGSLWLAHGPQGRLFRLDPATGEIEAEIEVSEPWRVFVTAGGVWTTSYPNGVVERVDPKLNEVVFRAQLGGNPNGLTEGFGAVWVADTGRGRLYRLDPAAAGGL